MPGTPRWLGRGPQCQGSPFLLKKYVIPTLDSQCRIGRHAKPQTAPSPKDTVPVIIARIMATRMDGTALGRHKLCMQHKTMRTSALLAPRRPPFC